MNVTVRTELEDPGYLETQTEVSKKIEAKLNLFRDMQNLCLVYLKNITYSYILISGIQLFKNNNKKFICTVILQRFSFVRAKKYE